MPPPDCGGLDEATCTADPSCDPKSGYRCSDGAWVYMACVPSELLCTDTAVPRCVDETTRIEVGTSGGCDFPNSDDGCPEGWTWVAADGGTCYPD
jgi:hypothetical protein